MLAHLYSLAVLYAERSPGTLSDQAREKPTEFVRRKPMSQSCLHSPAVPVIWMREFGKTSWGGGKAYAIPPRPRI